MPPDETQSDSPAPPPAPAMATDTTPSVTANPDPANSEPGPLVTNFVPGPAIAPLIPHLVVSVPHLSTAGHAPHSPQVHLTAAQARALSNVAEGISHLVGRPISHAAAIGWLLDQLAAAGE